MNEAYDLESFGYVALAGFLSAVLGAEREWQDKPAGLRTHVMVGSASALLMLLGEHLVKFFRPTEASDVIQTDPIRVIQAIIIGIGFLGAGTIVHRDGNRVEGLTTASSVFLTAAIGITVAVKRIWLAVEVTLFAVCILLMVGWLERRIAHTREQATDHSSE